MHSTHKMLQTAHSSHFIYNKYKYTLNTVLYTLNTTPYNIHTMKFVQYTLHTKHSIPHSSKLFTTHNTLTHYALHYSH